MANDMNNQALKGLFHEVLKQASQGGSAAGAVCARAFEERLPAMLQANDSAAEITLSEASKNSIVARLLDPAAKPVERNRGEAPNFRWALAGIAAAIIVGLAIWLATPPEDAKLIATPKKPVINKPEPEKRHVPKAPEDEPTGALAHG